MKIKVYIMHSEKRDYKEEIYKPLLEKDIMKKHYLILPLSNRYKGEFINDLLLDSDIVVCDLTNFNFLANIELKKAIKLGKKIKYFINSNVKNISKYKDIEITQYSSVDEFVNLVENYLDNLNHKEMILERENIFCLGKVNKGTN